MTQDEKDILLKDLCARLPYGVKVKFGDSNPSKITSITQGIDSNSWFIESEGESDGMSCQIDNVKPYLFPLSSMTKEQYKEWSYLGEEPFDEILTRNANGEKMSTLEHHLLIAKSLTDPVNYCYKNHFDIYGLIPMGLANDATGLNIY